MGDLGPKTMKLEDIWDEQVRYNLEIQGREPKELQGDDPQAYWAKQYLLGLVSEVDSVLDQINWKRHRYSHKDINYINLAHELADLTKYAFSLWQVFGFSLAEILDWIGDKGDIMRRLLEQETRRPDIGQKVLICDMDGTLADYRKGFTWWLEDVHDIFVSDPCLSLSLDRDIGMPYHIYHPLKEQFEREGGYRTLPAFKDTVNTIQEMSSRDIWVIIYTARPGKDHKRIWEDSWRWLQEYHITPDELHIGREERLLRARELVLEGNPVVLFEDEPDTALRAADMGILTITRMSGYNKNLPDGYPFLEKVHQYSYPGVLYAKGERVF